MKKTVNKWYPNETPGVFERFLCKVLPVRLIEQGKKLYLRRFYLTPLWFPCRVFLHHIFLSDLDRAFHDHPFSFRTIILFGWYIEYIQHNSFENSTGPYNPIVSIRILKRGSTAFNKAEHIHKLELEKPVWTLVIAGKGNRMWGFHDPIDGFVPWRKYLKMEDKALYKDYDEDVVNNG